MNKEFYKKFVKLLSDNIQGLWVIAEEEFDMFSWGYCSQSFGDNDIERFNLGSYEDVARDIIDYLKIAK